MAMRYVRLKCGVMCAMIEIPKGKSVGDVLDVFSGVKHRFYIGTPNPVCASCRKPFNTERKPRRAVRMYPVRSLAPILFSYNICGCCFALIQKGGADKEAVLVALEAYRDGDEAQQ